MSKQMTGAEMIVEALKDQGVEHVFGYPGGSVLPIYDAIFGQNTGLIATVGAGLRVALPRGSRRTWRLDLGIPLSRGLSPELRLGVGQHFGIFNGEPQDVVRSRERISSVTVFDFPRF